ncbi:MULTISPECIES: Sec-independent protein translocase protein TatB [Thiomicrorhabdus]|uniref:Sec-independent protein translocase protein TatB n=1 Tax=Thiomicrorhabdus heinhorstiae TaxID=2748010 RepID=A0ABS0BWT4_9GAMM|nr:MULTISPECIES: Sec-independent protein translocase protein TatB [Thiomicrorhabdus]MBF6057449.1 twin-arginine translocase subunit TatB [Thiomicrorhabdus heinhorstiae]
MFDIGFLEILVIMIIALIVIGPERMPEVARKIGSFMGKTRRFINSVKEEGQIQETIRDFKDSMNLEEEQRQISNITQELEQGLNFSDMSDLNVDELKRPFGSADTDAQASSGGNQFNRAPAQPVMPKPEAPKDTTPPKTASTAETSTQGTPAGKAPETDKS